MVEKGQGVGSIWNKGNWHWEERNYTEFAKDTLKKLWTSIVEETQDARISIYEIKELKGSASCTIRKQKQIFMYEFDGELYFKAVHLTDDRQDVMGRIKLFEFNQEDDEIQTELTCEKETTWANGVKSFMRNKMPKILHAKAKTLIDAMKEKDMDDQRLAEAEARSKQAEVEYKKIHNETAEQKMQIAAEQKKKEEEMKINEALKKASQPQQVQVQKKIEGTGSVWNTNSYHWEEKGSVASWAEEKLKSVLSGFKYVWNDTTLFIKEIKTFKGESSVSIRKGKKIVAYDYQILLAWQIDMLDKDGKTMFAQTKGTYELPEVSNEEAQWEVRVTMGDDPENIQNMLNQLIRGLAPSALKEAIKHDFVEELMKK